MLLIFNLYFLLFSLISAVRPGSMPPLVGWNSYLFDNSPDFARKKPPILRHIGVVADSGEGIRPGFADEGVPKVCADFVAGNLQAISLHRLRILPEEIPMMRSISLAGFKYAAMSLVIAAVMAISPFAIAVNVYRDTDGATAGGSSGTTAGGMWDAASTAGWSTSAVGDVATSTYAVANGGSPSTADVLFSEPALMSRELPRLQ